MQGKMLIAVNAVLPSFIMMAVGYYTKKALHIDKKEVQRFNAVIYHTLLSIMLFNNIYAGDLSEIANLPFFLLVLGILTVTFFLTLLFNVLTEPVKNRRGVSVQACIRSNFVLLGLPIFKELCPDGNLAFASALMAAYILLANVLAVIVLEVYSERASNRKTILLNIFKNPLIIATVLGMVFCVFRIRLPDVAAKTLSQMGSAATPVALLLLGAALEIKTIQMQKRSLFTCLTLRLVFVPLLALLVGMALKVGREEAVLLLGFFATPPSISSYNLVCAVGGDADYAANLAVLANLLSVFSLLLWTMAFQMIGLI